ncbi:addiction module toxin RelE [bacterium]|nr:addiction module toxin RelE [bacterium]
MLSSRQQNIVLDGIEKHLTYDATVVTRNRKPMRPNPVASWELRMGDLRIYYDVEEEKRLVYVLAIGIKIRNQVRIGKEVFIL